MRRLAVLVAALALVAAFAPSATANNAARIDRNFGCVVSSQISHGSFLFSEEDQISLVTESGNTLLLCRFRYPAGGAPTTTVTESGFICGTFLGITEQTRFVGTKSGIGILTCHINGTS